MAKKNKPTIDVATLQPDELGELKKVVQEFIKRLQVVDNEIDTLKEDRKTLLEEFSEKLDVRTLQIAMKVARLQTSVDHKDTYDVFIETLTDPAFGYSRGS